MPIEEIVESQGLEFEKHLVTTEDGITLELHRVYENSTSGKPPFLMQHGLLGSSESFLLNGEDASAQKFARLGYDVWVGNNRISLYSRRHNPNYDLNCSFWEMAKFDLVADVDYILSTTTKSKIAYMGHSEGTQIVFTALAENFGNIRQKLNVFVALAPVTSSSAPKNVLSLAFSKALPHIAQILELFEI